MTRCDCCDLPIESCGKEIERKQRREAGVEEQRLLGRGWFHALYAGQCSGCGTDFAAGELIKLQTTHGQHRCYIAECCKEMADA